MIKNGPTILFHDTRSNELLLIFCEGKLKVRTENQWKPRLPRKNRIILNLWQIGLYYYYYLLLVLHYFDHESGGWNGFPLRAWAISIKCTDAIVTIFSQLCL